MGHAEPTLNFRGGGKLHAGLISLRLMLDYQHQLPPVSLLQVCPASESIASHGAGWRCSIQAGDVLQTAGCHVPLPACGAVKANPPHPAGLLVPETSGIHLGE